jgi:hypothetical protein
VGDVIPMPPPRRGRSDDIEMDEVAWAKLRIAKLVWNMPTASLV